MEILLIDLERSIRYGRVYYWEENKMGYTTDLAEAGWYSVIDATNEIMHDVDRRTIGVPKDNVNAILGLNLLN